MAELKREKLQVARERALLVGVILPNSIADPMDPLGELRALARTAGAVVVDEMIAKRRTRPRRTQRRRYDHFRQRPFTRTDPRAGGDHRQEGARP
ncbi:MAG: hypothetical protein ACYSTL_04915 [Planctomycetota bacterium]|jgi:hypothetical protein